MLHALLHWLHLPVQQWITYKLAVLTCKVLSTSTPVYLHRRIAERARSRTLCSSAIPLLDQPFMRTDFSRRDFRFCFQHRLSATRCHSSVILFLNPDLKLFCSIRLLPNTDPTCRQRLRPYSAIEIRLLCPRPRGALSDDARDDVCLSRTSGLN